MKQTWILFLASISLAAFAPQLRAEEAPPTPEEEREAKEAKEEEDKENNLFPEVSLKGRVVLMPLGEDGKIPKVAGKITDKTGREILLKLLDPKNLRAKLLKLAAKDVQLRGYYRNAQKYLIVTDVDTEDAVPPKPVEGL